MLDNPHLQTIYIGGGTPNVLPFKLLRYFLTRLQSVIARCTGNSGAEKTAELREFSIECNPHLIRKEQLSLFRETGVTRISIGVQTFEHNLRTILGRKGSPAEVLRTLELVSTHWPGQWSADLISGIPGQTVQSALDDITTVSRFSPDHLSLYSLSLEPETLLWRHIKNGTVTPLSDDTEFDIWRSSLDFLKSNRYRRYEISNFEKNGKPCLHNMRYWNMLPYLGCGPSAVSTLYSHDGAYRYQNCRDISTYCTTDLSEWEIMKEKLPPEKLLFEFFMMGFRLADGIDLEHITKVFNFEWKSVLGPLFNSWEQSGYLYWIDKNRAALTDRGWQYNNKLLDDLLTQLETLFPLDTLKMRETST